MHPHRVPVRPPLRFMRLRLRLESLHPNQVLLLGRPSLRPRLRQLLLLRPVVRCKGRCRRRVRWVRRVSMKLVVPVAGSSRRRRSRLLLVVRRVRCVLRVTVGVGAMVRRKTRVVCVRLSGRSCRSRDTLRGGMTVAVTVSGSRMTLLLPLSMPLCMRVVAGTGVALCVTVGSVGVAAGALHLPWLRPPSSSSTTTTACRNRPGGSCGWAPPRLRTMELWLVPDLIVFRPRPGPSGGCRVASIVVTRG